MTGINLSDVATGKTVQIRRVEATSRSIESRLGELGFFEGATIYIISNRRSRVSPMIISLRGSQVMLSRDLASHIRVEIGEMD